jgi:hypothetical protein
LANWNEEESSKDIGKDYSQFRSVQHSTEGGINVVAVLKDVSHWECKSETPEVLQVSHEGCGIVDRRAFI